MKIEQLMKKIEHFFFYKIFFIVFLILFFCNTTANLIIEYYDRVICVVDLESVSVGFTFLDFFFYSVFFVIFFIVFFLLFFNKSRNFVLNLIILLCVISVFLLFFVKISIESRIDTEVDELCNILGFSIRKFWTDKELIEIINRQLEDIKSFSVEDEEFTSLGQSIYDAILQKNNADGDNSAAYIDLKCVNYYTKIVKQEILENYGRAVDAILFEQQQIYQNKLSIVFVFTFFVSPIIFEFFI